MHKNKYIVFDINSSKVVCMCASQGLNDSIVNLEAMEKEYNCTKDDPTGCVELSKIITDMLLELKSKVGKITKYIVVSVPNKLCLIDVKENEISIARNKRINENDFIKLIDFNKNVQITKKDESSIEANNETKYKNIFNSSICYKTDGSDESFCPRGQLSKKLLGRISYGFCNETFINNINGIFERNKYKAVFTIGSIVTLNNQLSIKKRVNPYLVVNIEDTISTFLVGKGDGIEIMESCTFCTNMVLNSIQEKFQIKQEEARKLLEMSVITLEDNDNLCYKINENTFSGKLVNLIIKDGLKKLIEKINSFVEQENVKKINVQGVIYFSGSGITRIKGLKTYLMSVLKDIKVEVLPIQASNPQLDMNKIDSDNLVSLFRFATDRY